MDGTLSRRWTIEALEWLSPRLKIVGLARYLIVGAAKA